MDKVPLMPFFGHNPLSQHPASDCCKFDQLPHPDAVDSFRNPKMLSYWVGAPGTSNMMWSQHG